jgi:hypothetical protein
LGLLREALTPEFVVSLYRTTTAEARNMPIVVIPSLPPGPDGDLTVGQVSELDDRGGLTPKAGGRLLDGRTWDEMPAVLSGGRNANIDKQTTLSLE